MTDVVALKKTQAEQISPVNNEYVDWLMEAVMRNRFLPCPDPDSVFVGDGDFQAVGSEFLG
ncbi:MAG: hypothetical protein M3036_15015, partial [Bifidobacteriales bacterium]|nr:hypothetical protein [Bifidobacteriales bacterium]